MSDAYVVGNMVRVSVTFTDETDAAVDPEGVTLAYKQPGGTATTLTYGTDEEIVRDNVGQYHALLTLAAGAWYYRWAGTGDGAAAGEGAFDMTASQVI